MRGDDEEGGGWKDRGRMGMRRENGVETGKYWRNWMEEKEEGVGRRQKVVE